MRPLLSKIEPVLEFVDQFPICIYTNRLGIAQDNVRRCVENFDATLQKLWRYKVIIGGPFEICCVREVKNKVEVGRTAQVPVVPIVANPPVLQCVFVAYLLGPVGRSVVRDDKFEVSICLSQYGIDRYGKIFLAIENRETYADVWHHRYPPILHNANKSAMTLLSSISFQILFRKELIISI